MGGYLAYAEYKDSGIEWLGKIPTHWTVDRVKWSVANCKNGTWGSEPDGENDLFCITIVRTVFDKKATHPLGCK